MLTGDPTPAPAVPVVAISPRMRWWNNIRIDFGWLAGRIVMFLYGLFLLTCGGAIVVVSVLGLNDSAVLGLFGVIFGTFSGFIGVLGLHQALTRHR
jgi:hypothetical protein